MDFTLNNSTVYRYCFKSDSFITTIVESEGLIPKVLTRNKVYVSLYVSLITII